MCGDEVGAASAGEAGTGTFPVGPCFTTLQCYTGSGMAHAGAAPIDRYVVLEHLSEGGMGTIYVGKKLGAGGFEMAVVLKQLLPEFTQQEEFIDLFLREARLSATLHHANIIHTIDLVTTGGEYFIVMEYLPGADLRTLLRRAKRRGKRFTPKAAIYISREVLSALAYAHTKRDDNGNPIGLIHRDVSPANVLLSPAGEVKLTDFGIAKATAHTSQLYKVKGKVGYMSPEQAKSEPLDHRSDLYSLAVCTYEILTGERLFVNAGLTTSAELLYAQPIPLVSRKVPGLSSDLDAIMAKALAIDPNRRFQTAGEFQEALMRCAHRNGLLMPAAGLASELRDACGPTEGWRDGDADESASRAALRGATEIYDPSEGDDSSSHASTSGLNSTARSGTNNSSSHSTRSKRSHVIAATQSRGEAHTRSAAAVDIVSYPRGGTVTPKTATLERFHGKELTSIIHRIEPAPIERTSPADEASPIDRDPQASSAAAAPLIAGPPTNPQPADSPVASSPYPMIPSWLIIGVIVLIAGITATIVALSGPSVTGR